MVGSGFMAQQHTAAYRLLPILHPHLPPVELVRIAGGRRVHNATRYGWSETSDDIQSVTDADDIDLVDIVTPNDTHAELLIAASAHGKSIVCEKPLARTSAEAAIMQQAISATGVRATVCFVYRTWPATDVAKHIIDSGEIGEIIGYRGHFLHDHTADERDTTAWRFDPNRSGSGVVGDIGSHAIDLATYLVGDITALSATTRSVLPGGTDDEADIDLRFHNGAQGHIWLSWLATGTPMDMGFRVMGTAGSIEFSWSKPAQLQVYSSRSRADRQGFTTVQLGPAHAPAAPYVPLAGLGLSYQQAFVPLLSRFLDKDGAAPTIDEAVSVTRVLDEILESARTSTWRTIR